MLALLLCFAVSASLPFVALWLIREWRTDREWRDYEAFLENKRADMRARFKDIRS